MELVDILLPPRFEKSGVVKTREEAWQNRNWIGTFNLWITQDKPEPAIVYQKRSADSSWGPNLLDVTAGGHYRAGESAKDGLREVKEELGKTYEFKDLTYLGRKIHISPDEKKRMRHNVLDIFMVKDNSVLEKYILEKDEVEMICLCPINKLIKVHTIQGYAFKIQGLTNKKEVTEITVTMDSFPYNWDNYHLKIALLAKRFLAGEKHLIY